mgnify:CR=1 FL=1
MSKSFYIYKKTAPRFTSQHRHNTNTKKLLCNLPVMPGRHTLLDLSIFAYTQEALSGDLHNK